MRFEIFETRDLEGKLVEMNGNAFASWVWSFDIAFKIRSSWEVGHWQYNRSQ